MAKSAEEAAFVGDLGEVYKITKELVNANTKADPPVLDLNRNILSTDDEKLNRWREQFESVLNHAVSSDVAAFAPTTNTISPARSIPQTPPSKSEIVSAIKSISSGKVAGSDGIPAEFYKSNPYMAAEVLQPILEEAWLSKAFPEECTDGIIVKMPKKGNLKICNNWRGICDLPAISKIISKVILDRIKDHLYAIIDPEQTDFRPCVDHINTLRIIIEHSAEYRSDLYLFFVHFEKAFDSVEREGIWMALRRRRITNKMVSVIQSTYNGAKRRELHNGTLSAPFVVSSGFRQG